MASTRRLLVLDHWLDGSRTPSRRAGRVTIRAAREPFAELADLALASVDEFEAASDVRTRSPGPDANRAVECFEDAAYDLEERPADSILALTESAQGWPVARPRSFDRVLDRLDEAADRLRAKGNVLVFLPWTDELVPAFERVCEALLRAERVLVVSDARAPFVSDLVVDALIRAGWPPDRLGLLHGLDVPGALAGLANGWRLEGLAEREWVRTLKRKADEPGFVRLAVPRSTGVSVSALDVERSNGVERLARRGVARGLEPLFGQAPDSVAVWHVATDVFAPFEEAFVAAFDEHPMVLEPGPLIDAGQVERFAQKIVQGLDEGATLVRGKRQDDARARRRPLVSPALFTNAEARGRLALSDAPLPVLSLVRARS